MATAVVGKLCPLISTPEKLYPCVRECQFCKSGSCDLANLSNLTTQVKVLTKKIDELSEKLK